MASYALAPTVLAAERYAFSYGSGVAFGVVVLLAIAVTVLLVLRVRRLEATAKVPGSSSSESAKRGASPSTEAPRP